MNNLMSSHEYIFVTAMWVMKNVTSILNTLTAPMTLFLSFYFSALSQKLWNYKSHVKNVASSLKIRLFQTDRVADLYHAGARQHIQRLGM